MSFQKDSSVLTAARTAGAAVVCKENKKVLEAERICLVPLLISPISKPLFGIFSPLVKEASSEEREIVVTFIFSKEVASCE